MPTAWQLLSEEWAAPDLYRKSEASTYAGGFIRELFREQSLIVDFPAKLASNSQAAHFLNGEKVGHGCTRRKFFKHGAESSMGIHPLFP